MAIQPRRESVTTTDQPVRFGKGAHTWVLDLQAPALRMQRDPKVKENAKKENQKENRPQNSAVFEEKHSQSL